MSHPDSKRKVRARTVLLLSACLGLAVPPLEALAAGPDGARAREALELEVYGVSPRARIEALRRLATLEKTTPAGALLKAMEARAPSTARIAADALLLDARWGGEPVGLALLRAATRENQARVNLLVALYAEDVAALAKKRTALDPLDRVAVVNELALYAPLSAQELEALLQDEALGVRLAAARAIAPGEGETLQAAVRARVRPTPPSKPALPGVQARWLELYGDSGPDPCGRSVLFEVAEDSAVPVGVRAAALKALGGCNDPAAERVVLRAAEDPVAAVRAGAVSALESMPRAQGARRVVAAALEDASAEVRKAGLGVVAAQRLGGLGEKVGALLTDQGPEVRAAAVRALARLGARGQVAEVAQRLRADPDRDVRAAAAEALGELGGPVAVGALGEAAAGDPETRVRYLADRELRRLGFRQ